MWYAGRIPAIPANPCSEVLVNDVDIEFPSARVGPSKAVGHYLGRSAFERFVDAYRRAAAALPPAEARTIETSYGLARCYRFLETGAAGRGRAPIVLLSGRNAATPMWAPAIPDLLALHRPVYAFDSIGEAGCSAQTAPLDTTERQTAWVVEAPRRWGTTGSTSSGTASEAGWPLRSPCTIATPWPA